MKKVLFSILGSMICAFAMAQTIEQTYHYGSPMVKSIDGYQIVNLEGCRPTGNAGEPILPWQHVSLMLPQGTEAQSISVEYSDFVTLDSPFNLYPTQPDRPISADGPFEFVKNEDLYRSAEAYPLKTDSDVHTYYLNGVAFAFSGFTPMRYVATNGTVSYATTVRVKVETTASRTNHSAKLWLRPENVRSMNKLAQNEGMLSTYSRRNGALPEYEVLVITPETYIGYFDQYIELYAERGIRVRVATTQDIYASSQGRDNKEKIRNYIIEEYEKSGIQSVVLGGDVALVPHRSLWCHAQDGYDDNVPSDLYYAGLDGTWNDDNDNKWGEIGEDDLLPEIAISRLPFNNTDDLETILAKTFSYLTSPVLGEFHTTTLAGEHLGDGYYASSDLERLVGMSDFNGYTTYGYDEEVYDIHRVYETPTHYWDADELRDDIRGGTQYVNHFGHANTSYVAGWYNWDITPELFSTANGVDHNYTFFQSQGCICGDFADDCILECMVNNETGIIAATGNSRYGWYSTAGDASSAHFNRELVDAYNHERIPDLGNAFKESKIQTAPFITMNGEIGTMRWTMYALNALGDGSATVWFDEPFTPVVEHPVEIQVGTNRIPVDVTDENGNPLYNFACRLFDGDGDLIGAANTDLEGHANIDFYPVVSTDSLTLYVTGMSAWPQHFAINFPHVDCAFVMYDNIQLNDEDGQIDYNEDHTVNMTFRNVGNLDASNVTATLVCDQPEYITVTQGQAIVGNMESFAYQTIDNAFEFTVCDSVPDLTEVEFTLICTDGTEEWISHFSVIAHAPSFEIIEVTMDEVEGNGNGIADPGENLTLHFTIRNTGSSHSNNTHFGVYCSAPEISFDENEFTLGELNPGENITVDFNFSISPDLTEATAFELILASYCGRYFDYDHHYINVGCEVEDFETGDFTKYDWQFSTRHWAIDNNDAYEGNYCAKSPSMNNNQSASLWLDYEVACENEFSFYYKVSSEAAYDWLTFYVDDELMNRWAGEEGWAKATFVLPEGQHQLKWTYAKDAGASSGQDCAWIDFLVFPPDAIVMGMGSYVEDNVNVYPNPTTGLVNIEAEGMQHITIMNTLGQMIYDVEANGSTTLDLGQYGTGIYMIRLTTKDGVIVKRVSVE